MLDNTPGVIAVLIVVCSALALAMSCAKAFAAESACQYELTLDRTAVNWHGRAWKPVDDSGVFYYDPSQTLGCPIPGPSIDLEAILKRHGFHGVTRCKLVDFVDCAGIDHRYAESGGSRVLEINGDTYRITTPAGALGWFSYDLATNPTPGRPHLVVCQLMNDRERYTTVSLDQADDTTWADPYKGEEKYVPENQEGGTWRRDVGAAVYTGREYPCNGESYTFALLFYPKTSRATVTISHNPCEIDFDQLNGAAVARIWMFDVLDPLPPALDLDESGFNAQERKFALYVPHPWFLYSHFGIPPREESWRVKSLRSMVQYLKFCGFNQIQLHIINGSDRASRAWYDSGLYKNLEGNLFKELLPIAESEGLEVVPIVTPLTSPFDGRPHEVSEEPDEHGWSRDSCLLDKEGEDYTRAFGGPVPNPLRPEVQGWQLACFKEILDRCAHSRAVPAVGFRVNGKIGLCFTGDLWNRCGDDSGYNQWMVEQFTQDTGIEVPLLKPTSYQYIRDNCWDEWLQWRCVKTREFWIRCRDFIRSYRSDLKFLAACDLPSETPGYNLEWPSGQHSIRDLFRHHGYDPGLFVDDEGMWIQRGMMVASDRYWYDSWFPYKKNAYAHKMFNYAPGVAESYSVPDSSGVELYHNYWEESPHPKPQYGPYMRTATPSAYKDFFYEPAVYSIRKVNVDRIVFMGWQRACAGHEHDIRRFARAFRAIPLADPKEFDGKLEVLEDGPQTPLQDLPDGYQKPEHDVLWAAWFGDRLAVVNDAFCSRRVRLTFPHALQADERVIEHGSGRTVASAVTGGEVSLCIDLRPFDLQVFSVTALSQPKLLTASVAEQAVELRLDSTVATVTAGDETEFNLVLQNNTSAAINNIVLNTRLPRGWNKQSGEKPALQTLLPGASAVFPMKASIDLSSAGTIADVEVTASYSGSNGIDEVSTTAITCSQYPVLVSQDIPVFAALPGETAYTSVNLTNRSGRPRLARLNVTPPPGWTVDAAVERLLEPLQTVKVPIPIRVPKNAIPRSYTLASGVEVEDCECPAAAITVDVALPCPRILGTPGASGFQPAALDQIPNLNVGLFRASAGTDVDAVTGLSPEGWLNWDDDCLYIALRTKNTQLSNPFSDDEMWKGDSLQVGIHLCRSTPGPQGFFEFAIAASVDGVTRTRCFRAPHDQEVSQIVMSGLRAAVDESGSTYQAAISWSDLGVKPQPGDLLGLALVINDYDGSNRTAVLLGDGLVKDKDPAGFMCVRLEP